MREKQLVKHSAKFLFKLKHERHGNYQGTFSIGKFTSQSQIVNLEKR